ncbi:MAG: hypothetical protein ABIR24_05800 [Verrucomicrobiota bacterium]
MEKTYLLRLESNDLGQILDGLRVRVESWRNTADYFASGHNANDSFVIEECSGEREARQIANFYSRIVRNLERQFEEQNGKPLNEERELYLQGKADGQGNMVLRILNEWQRLKKMTGPRLRARLEILKDEICDD